MKNTIKRVLAMVLCIATVLTSTVFAAVAGATENPCIRISDTDGMTGYGAAGDDIGAIIAEKGGVTVVMDVFVESYTAPSEGMFSQIAAFTGGGTADAKYNLLSYDFTDKAFKAGQTNAWISDNPADDYAAVSTNPFNWETGKWYELAFRFNGKKAAIYLNGICVISTEFDATSIEYLIVHPQFCDVRIDNVKICDKAYDVANGVGTVIAAENFDSLSDATASETWVTFDYEMSNAGCDGIITTIKDNCVRINATDNTSGYSAAQDAFNEMVAAEGGVTLVADVYLNGITEAPAGQASQLVAFTGAYSANDRYNYAGIDFGANELVAMESGSWVYDGRSDLTSVIGTKNFTWETGVWYEMAWQFDGNNVAVYVNGEKMLTSTVSSVNNSYIILFAQYCDVKIDNIRLCDKAYDVANGIGTVWGVENYRSAVSYDTSDVWYVDSTYTLDAKGTDVYNVGDVDGNEVCNLDDFTALSKVANGSEMAVSKAADVDMNGAIDLNDMSLLSKIVNGYVFTPNIALNVTPVAVDNSAVVEDEPAEPDTPVEPPVTSQTEKPVTSESTTQKPAEPESNETFIDGLDGSTLKFNGMEAASYTFAKYEGGINDKDIALSFDVLVSEIDTSADFAGLGVWNSNNFVGYDFKDQALVSDTIGYPYGPSSNGKALTLKVGEWNHFNFRRINNDTFHLYINGVKQLEVTGQKYADTFFLFGFKNCTAYVDNYQAYENGAGKGLYDTFSTFTKNSYMLVSPDGGYWMVGDQGFGGICTNVVAGVATESGIAGTGAAAGETVTEAPATSEPVTEAPASTATPYDPDANVDNGSGDKSGNDESVLKFDTTSTPSYSLLFSDQPQSYADMALTFDVKIESVKSGENFAGLGVWNGNADDDRSTFVGYDYNDKQFVSNTNMFYPTTPDAENGPKLNLQVGEWNHFCFRRLNNNTFQVYVNGKLYYEVTNQNYDKTYFIFAFKNVVAYVDNYQYYHGGAGCGLVDDFTAGASTDDKGFMKFSDGGYWIVLSGQGFEGVITPASDAAVKDTVAKINAIGTVTYNSLSAITAAETAYAGLTDIQKSAVSNYSTLTAARSTYDALHAEVVTYKNMVAKLPATASNTEACKTAIANCAIAYATLTSPGQVDAVATEKAKYDALRAEWEKLVAASTESTATPYDPDANVDSGSGDKSGNDESVLKFDTTSVPSYSLLFSSQPQSYTDMALTFDVKIESVVAGEKFAGLGVWSGNADSGMSSFVGYDFIDHRFTNSSNTTYPSTPTSESGPKLNLDIGEWNHFCFRRLNNNKFEVYVNGKLYYEVTGQSYANTYFIFAFDNVVAYVDNYQYYHGGTACGLVDDFAAGATSGADGFLRFSDGGYWIVFETQGFAGVVTPASDAAVKDTVAKINAIGTVTYNSLSAISAAENAYANLTDIQKNAVSNYSTLTTARSTYDALHAEVVAYKNAVAALPAKAENTDACRTAVANCAIAYATLTSPGQVDAVATEKAKYDTFRAEWEKAVAASTATSATTAPPATSSSTTQKPVTPPADVDMGNGSGDKSGIDGSALKFTASGSVSYSLLFSDQPQSYPNMALSFDVMIESIDSGVDFAGLGVWSGNGTDSRSSFTGYDFVDKRFTGEDGIFFPNAPTADSNVKMNLQVGEWNHFTFRRFNNSIMEVYVNGKLCYEMSTGYNYADTYFIFAFKNCTAYVDNYQYYHNGTGCGLVTDFTAGATTDANGDTRFSDGGYWVVGSLNYAGVVKGQPGFDGSALKFNGNSATSYTLVLNEGPISNNDVALTFDVFVESIDSAQKFAGLGVWNGDGTFIGYDFKDQKFTAAKSQGYPYPPDADNGGSLKLNVGEWNHFVFRRISNTSFVVYVNGVKGAEITGLSFTNTYMIFGFKHCVGYIDNYQAYENGTGKGLYTNFSDFTKRSDGALISPDGGYWIVGTQGFDSIYTTKTGGGVTGSGIAGTAKAAGSNTIDGVGRITFAAETTTTTTTTTQPPVTTAPSGGGTGELGVSVDWSVRKVSTGWELANRAVAIANNYKTLYIMGCFGAPMTASNKARYTQNHSYNMNATRTAMINAASSDTFGFDCVCLIKGILWGWAGKLNTNYGGASYTSNGVPDFGSDATSAYVNNTRSKDWSNIAIGEAVWMSGHIGIYIGNGLAVECTPKWANDVQITAVGNIGSKAGYNTRTWTAHGKLKYVSY